MAIPNRLVTPRADWKPSYPVKEAHAPLDLEHREAAGRYIDAIVTYSLGHDAGEETRQALASVLWMKWRDTYDYLREGSGKTRRQDFARAMRLL